MSNQKEARIKIMNNGPYQVSDHPLIKMQMILNSSGRPVGWKRGPLIENSGSYELCRCGASSNKPFCDWTHESIRFNGTETAGRKPSKTRAKAYKGQGLIATDSKTLCVHAGFCVTERTDFWDLIEQEESPIRREALIKMIQNCPSGRLEYKKKEGGPPVEESLPKEIGIIENGPLYVRGGIVVEGANGKSYEVRNRITLCRCGASENKPFCDGKHADIGFRDNL